MPDSGGTTEFSETRMNLLFVAAEARSKIQLSDGQKGTDKRERCATKTRFPHNAAEEGDLFLRVPVIFRQNGKEIRFRAQLSKHDAAVVRLER